MVLKIVQNTLMIQVDSVGTLTIALCMLLCGHSLKKKSQMLQELCLPDVVIGGIIFMLIRMLLHIVGLIEFEIDTTFQPPAMVAFFTCIGIMTDLHKGNFLRKILIKYWGTCALLVIIQNVVGICMAIILNIPPVYGVLAGTTTMMGGHGNGSAFGLTASNLGFSKGQEIGIACATFGMLCGAILGAPFAKSLIKKYNLSLIKPKAFYESTNEEEIKDKNIVENKSIILFKNLFYITLIMEIGSFLASFISKFLNNIVLPEYIGGMFLGLIIRNTICSKQNQAIDYSLISNVSNVFLNIFLSISMISIEIWQLKDIAIELLVILMVQVLLILIYTRLFVFPFLGKNYDAAVICAGLIGHGLGATPNAIANMDSVCRKYGNSNIAMIVVPAVAASLIDLVMIPTIIFFFNFAVSIS